MSEEMTEEPLFVTLSSMPPFEEYCKEIAPLWESHWLTNMGALHHEFEHMLNDYLNVDDIALFVNGHQTLEFTFEAFELKGKVITTPFTFASTTHAIVRKGLTPVFADVKADDYTIDPEQVEALIDEDTCAIVPVHVYGNLCDTDALADIAKRHNLKLIYDAAHAFGVKKNGVTSGEFGDASMYSFHATKAFHTIEGGAVCLRNPELKTKLDHMKNFGIVGKTSIDYIGGNAKMNEFAAAMGICNLRHYSEEIAKRKAAAERYWERLEGLKGVRYNKPVAGVEPNFVYFPIVFDDEYGATRDEVFSALAAHNIRASKYFYPLTNDLACYKGMPGFDANQTPVAKNIAERVLTLPMYAGLTNEQVDRVCDVLLETARN